MSRNFPSMYINAIGIGCSDGGCILRDNSKGMYTNGGCNCARELTRIRPVGFDAVRTINHLRRQIIEYQQLIAEIDTPPPTGAGEL